jgi:hypothetical protein
MKQPPRGIQQVIHFIEEGRGAALLRGFLVVLSLALATVIYQMTETRNFVAPEAMDSAQLGRNLAEGKGYTTSFIRPLSLHLLRDKIRGAGGDPRTLLEFAHPDLENPPLYPMLLAGLMKVLPAEQRFALAADEFTRRPAAEVAISVLNLGLFALATLLVFSLAKNLFDAAVGWLSALLFLGTELLWRFANSGLSTLLLMVLVLAFARAWIALDQTSAADSTASGRRRVGLALLVGGLLGLIGLTRYSAAWLVVPTLVVLALTGARARLPVLLSVAAAFALVLGPWVARNVQVSGLPFGTATYAWLTTTESFPRDRLERSQNPVFRTMDRMEPIRKTLGNCVQMMEEELPRIGGNWVVAFFLFSLFVSFKTANLGRLRWLLFGMVATLLVVQASIRSSMAELSPVVNGENLLVLMAPLLFIFAAAMLQLALDQVDWPVPLLRRLVTGALILFFSGPLLLSLLPPRKFTAQEPYYRPGIIRTLADYSPPGTLMMSDVPWAMAWYGPRDCVWNSLRVMDEADANLANRREDFFMFTEGRRRVRAVYISPLWANQPMQSRFFGDPDFAWGRYYLDVLLRERVPTGFPLKYILGGGFLSNGHFFLAEEEWWGSRRPRAGSGN